MYACEESPSPHELYYLGLFEFFFTQICSMQMLFVNNSLEEILESLVFFFLGTPIVNESTNNLGINLF
jgi:hypothetical protein